MNFADYPIGKVIFLVPNHSCMAAACFSRYHVIDNDKDDTIVDVWEPCKYW